MTIGFTQDLKRLGNVSSGWYYLSKIPASARTEIITGSVEFISTISSEIL